MSLFDNEPTTPDGYTLGQPLDGLSVADIDQRIGMLRAEIDRLEEDKRKKLTTRDDAEMAFKPSMGGN